MAAFANRAGGYIVFGINNAPHMAVGMSNDRFLRMDPATFGRFLNNHFSPAIAWEHTVQRIGTKHFGVICTPESDTKPVMCIRTAPGLRDGDIYYRYQAETRLISAADLARLIAMRVDAERSAWRELIARAAQIGPTSSYLLDTREGRAVSGKKSFVVDAALLEKVRLIEEGQFDEMGEPALRVVGDVEVVRPELLPTIKEVPVDPSLTCRLWEAEIVHRVQKAVGEYVNFGSEQKRLNGYHIRCVVKAHDIQSPSEFYYRPSVEGSRAMYSLAFVDWLISQYREDPQFFHQAYLQCKHMPTQSGSKS